MSNLKIEIKNSRYDKERIILKSAEVEINKYGIFFVNGRNGAGKSTLFKSMLGEISSEIYRININNNLITKASNKIVYINENFIGYEFFKIKEYLIYISLLFKTKVTYEEITDLLSEVELLQYEHDLIKDLSQGNKQKLAFVATIIIDGEVLLFDESFEHIDEYVMKTIKRVLSELSKDHFIFLTSHTGTCRELSSGVIFIEDGESYFELH